MEKTENRSIGLNKNVTRVIKGSIFSIVISIILLLIYATVLTYTNVSENTMTVVLIAISGISILIGSSISSFKIKKQGMLNGALVGLIYMIFIYWIQYIYNFGYIKQLPYTVYHYSIWKLFFYVSAELLISVFFEIFCFSHLIQIIAF